MSRRKIPLPPHIARVLTYIYAHVDEPLRLEALSAIAGISAFHLQREFTRAVRPLAGARVRSCCA